jgi:hypothetical protein
MVHAAILNQPPFIKRLGSPRLEMLKRAFGGAHAASLRHPDPPA